MPIVEYHAAGPVIRFKNWVGSNSSGDIHSTVTVLYDPANLFSALIDRLVMNWIPWAPTFVVGLFLFLLAMNDFLNARRNPSP